VAEVVVVVVVVVSLTVVVENGMYDMRHSTKGTLDVDT
jgi:hypothetical protein